MKSGRLECLDIFFYRCARKYRDSYLITGVIIMWRDEIEIIYGLFEGYRNPGLELKFDHIQSAFPTRIHGNMHTKHISNLFRKCDMYRDDTSQFLPYSFKRSDKFWDVLNNTSDNNPFGKRLFAPENNTSLFPKSFKRHPFYRRIRNIYPCRSWMQDLWHGKPMCQ